MSSVFLSGSAFVAPGTPRNVGTISSSGNYLFQVDAGAMTDGDELEIRIANAVGPGTASLQYDGMYADRQAVQLKTSEPFVVVRAGAQMDLRMTAGGARWFYFDLITVS